MNGTQFFYYSMFLNKAKIYLNKKSAFYYFKMKRQELKNEYPIGR